MKKYNKILKYIPFIIFAFAFAWRLIGINAQGETWDEIAYFDAGHAIMANIKNADFDSNNWDINKEHPPIAKYIYGVVSIPSFLNNTVDYTNGRVASAFMGALTILIVFYLAKELFTVEIASLSAVILTFMPDLVGLNKVYGLDTPTLLFFTLTIYLFIKACKGQNLKYYIFSGLSLGLAIGTRFNNFILFLLLPIIYLIMNGWNFRKKEQNILPYLVVIPIIALLIFYITWPWIWTNSIEHLKISFDHWGGIRELFLGQMVSPGYSYYFVYLGVTTPMVILALLIPFLVQFIKEPKKNYWVILGWFIISFLVTFSPTKQNGMRYMICIYPALAIMASVGFFYLYKKKMAIIFGILLTLYLILANLSIHPYYLTYYNELVGGTRGVYDRKLFPIGYWGEGVEEAMDWISKEAPNGAKVYTNTSPNHTAGHKTWENLIMTQDNPDYIILNLNSIWFYNQTVASNYKLVKTVKSAGVPFIQIYKK